MFGSEVIEVGIGMALLFAFMSMIATALRELIENWMKKRATDLERGIKELLDETNNKGATADLYRHPLIASLYEGDYKSGDKRLPSYIPRESFASAILDIVAKASVAGSALSLGTLRASLASVSTPNSIQRAVLVAIGTSEGDLSRVRDTLEGWFDGTMDRVSGWYTRRTGKILFVLGFAAAVAFNVDAITVAERLVTDKSLRDAAVKAAEQSIAPGSVPPELGSLSSKLTSVGFPIGWTVPSGTAWPLPVQACRADELKAIACTGTPMSLGYAWAIARRLPGWLITSLAIMLGSPFWFDVLDKLMVIRSTVKPKQKSPDAGSADRPAPASPFTPTPAAASDGPVPDRP